MMLLNKEWTELWITKLRSGEYKQGRGHLHSDNDCFCCLGVLCDIVIPGHWKKIPDSYFYTLGIVGTTDGLVYDKIGLSYDRALELVRLNDCEKVDFNKIADQLQEWLNEDISSADGLGE